MKAQIKKGKPKEKPIKSVQQQLKDLEVRITNLENKASK